MKVSEHEDNELWNHLIDHVVQTPDYIVRLLHQVGSSINPLSVIQKVGYVFYVQRFSKKKIFESSTIRFCWRHFTRYFRFLAQWRYQDFGMLWPKFYGIVPPEWTSWEDVVQQLILIQRTFYRISWKSTGEHSLWGQELFA